MAISRGSCSPIYRGGHMSEARASRVLLVDDDSSLRGILTIHLAMAGYEALQAEDGLHALGILRNTLPNVIISDLKNQRMSGLEFMGVVRRRFPTIPVIVFSGSIPIEFPTGSEPDRMIEKGPGTFPELMRAVDELARTTPDDVPPQQVISVPVRTGPGFDGCITLTCTDCLRTFTAPNRRHTEAMAGAAVCSHCKAHVPFVIDGAAPA